MWTSALSAVIRACSACSAAMSCVPPAGRGRGRSRPAPLRGSAPALVFAAMRTHYGAAALPRGLGARQRVHQGAPAFQGVHKATTPVRAALGR